MNGYNEAFVGWGREDSELAVRLMKIGLRRLDVRGWALCYHLWHPPASRAGLSENDDLLAQAQRSGATRCEFGVSQYLTQSPDMIRPPLSIAHLNSMLTGGGTDDQCVKLARGLCQLQQQVTVVGPDGREFSQIARKQEVPFHPTPPEGPLKLRFILAAAKFVRTETSYARSRPPWP